MKRSAGWHLVLAAVAASAGAPAMAQDAASAPDQESGSPVYGALRLGASRTIASGLRSTSPRVTGITGQDRTSTAVVASAALGYQPVGSPVRVEVEASWRGDAFHRIDAVGTCTVALCGQNFDFRGNQLAKIKTKTLMANLFYDQPLGGDVSLFAGGGAGVAQLRSSAVQQFNIVQAPQAGTQTGAIWPERTKTNFAFSLTAGLAKRVGRKTTFELGGRYVNMGRYNTGFNTNLFADERFSARLAAAEAFLGVRFGF